VENKPIILRPYQEDIIEIAESTDGNVLIQSPTGSGKTVIARVLSKNSIERDWVVLVVVPRKNLLTQVNTDFKSLNPQSVVGTKQYDNTASLFTGIINTLSSRELDFTPNLIIIDEVHLGFNGIMFTKLLENFEGKVIGLSATPYDSEGKLIQGFDRVVDKYDISYLINAGYLVPVEAFCPLDVDLHDIKMTTGDYNLKSLDKKFNTMEAILDVVNATKKVIKKRKQAICFCITIEHSIAMAKAYNAVGIKAKAYHSNLKPSVATKILEDYKAGKIDLLTNPSSLTLGFDHPPIDTVILARATKSQNLYRQITGRGLRPSGRKKSCYLLDCAGVIKDLGLPTEPIRVMEKKKRGEESIERNLVCCESCGSEKVHRELREGTLYRVCQSCNHLEDLFTPVGYTCESCKAVHGRDAKLIIKDAKLYLDCHYCKELTLVSDEKDTTLEAIYDPAYVNEAVAKVIGDYVKWLISRYGGEFIFTEKAKRQILALEFVAREFPERLSSFSVENSPKYDYWRIIRQSTEFSVSAKLLALNKEKGVTFEKIAKRANLALLEENRPTISDEVILSVKEAIQLSNDDNFEKKVIQALISLFNEKKDCSELLSII